MKGEILVLNCGSSSVKYGLYSRKTELVRGIIEHVGSGKQTYKKAIQQILSLLVTEKYIGSLKDIVAVGHRVVHGGILTSSCIITKATLGKIKDAAKLAPLHNPHNIEGIVAIQNLLRYLPQIAVFDTTFHRTIPEVTHYALPGQLRKKYKRYGFHGISYQYICSRLKKKLGELPQRLIICHLGNGSSIAAVKNGRCIDTSMGNTPIEGLIMGTRGGDTDPGVVLDLCHEKDVYAVDTILNKKSGLFGICGTQDMREIWKRAKKGNKKAQLASDMYCYRVRKYIGSYAATLGGIDALIFTGGIGEHAWWVREQVCTNLGFLGIHLDVVKNRAHKEKVSLGKVKVYVLPTNEEEMIALEVRKLVQ
jgi:acetate kinase